METTPTTIDVSDEQSILDKSTLAAMALAQAVIQAVTDVDLEHDVAAAVKSFTVTCHGAGTFVLAMESDTPIDVIRLQNATIVYRNDDNGRPDETRLGDQT